MCIAKAASLRVPLAPFSQPDPCLAGHRKPFAFLLLTLSSNTTALKFLCSTPLVHRCAVLLPSHPEGSRKKSWNSNCDVEVSLELKGMARSGRENSQL